MTEPSNSPEPGPSPSEATAGDPLDSGNPAQIWHPIDPALTGAWVKVRTETAEKGTVETVALMMVARDGLVSWVERPPRGQVMQTIPTPDAWRLLTLEESL